MQFVVGKRGFKMAETAQQCGAIQASMKVVRGKRQGVAEARERIVVTASPVLGQPEFAPHIGIDGQVFEVAFEPLAGAGGVVPIQQPLRQQAPCNGAYGGVLCCGFERERCAVQVAEVLFEAAERQPVGAGPLLHTKGFQQRERVAGAAGAKCGGSLGAEVLVSQTPERDDANRRPRSSVRRQRPVRIFGEGDRAEYVVVALNVIDKTRTLGPRPGYQARNESIATETAASATA